MGVKTDLNEVFIPIDTEPFPPVNLVNTKEIKKQRRKDKAAFNRMLDERKTTIDDDAWDRWLLVAKACYLNDSEADLYDVFDTLRVYKLGGWPYRPEFLNKVDAEIEKEYGRTGVI